jgi:ABC-type Na+ efflux pump permease subunit
MLRMTFLPIVERELRVAARRRGTYWARLAVAMGAVLIGVPVYFVTQIILGLSPQMTGQYVFQGFSGMLLVYCLLYGRQATADCLSAEKREGTLGLLFLTDLRGADVVGGKLAATSLGGFYGLVAVFPVLAVTLLLGGISNGEFWRMVLLLVVTFLFTLAIGIFTSALSRDHHRAMAANFLSLLFLVGFLPACGYGIAFFFGSIGWIFPLYLTCPFFAFQWCFDVQYKLAAGPFWWTLAVMHGLTWTLLFSASVIVRNSWQDRPAGTPSKRRGWEGFWHACSFGSRARQERFREQALGVNAFYWLAARASLKPVHVWIFLGLMAVWWIGGWAASGTLWFDESEYVATALLLNSTLKLWVVVEAGQQLAQEKQSGSLELLLSTPLSVRQILRGQWRALRRQFLAPVIVVLFAELLFLWLGYQRSPNRGMRLVWLAGMVMLVSDIVALSWVAMAQALAARSHRRATLETVGRILILPWAMLSMIVAARGASSVLMPGPAWEPESRFCVGLWFGLGLGADLLFGFLAWRQLHYRFRALAGQSIVSAPMGATQGVIRP